MKMARFFNSEITPADYEVLRDGAVQARLVMLLTGYDPDKALTAFRQHEEMPFAVRIAACEGIIEYQDRVEKGRRTWTASRWVNEALRTMLAEARRKNARA